MRPRPRAALRATALLVVGLAWCGCGDEPGSSPRTTRLPEERASLTGVVAGPEEAAVLRAYAASWDAFGGFVNGDLSGEPSHFFDGDQLANVVDRVTQYADEGLELRGEADLSPHDVAIVGDAASLVDCQIDRTYAMERSTGDVVIPASGRAQEVVVELVRADGHWKVSSVDYAAEGSCDR